MKRINDLPLTRAQKGQRERAKIRHAAERINSVNAKGVPTLMPLVNRILAAKDGERIVLTVGVENKDGE